MENAGKDDIPNEAERKGLGTPATRAAIIEKLVTAGFVERKGKNLIPTKAGINLVTILPEPLTSPMLTAEWEQKLTEIAKGGADPDTFMDGIRTMVQEIVSTYVQTPADIAEQAQAVPRDTFSIYQLKPGDTTRDYRFEPLDAIRNNGLSVKPENYELVYTAPLTEQDSLESIYTRFNIDHPADFKGHSLSVSDIVVLHQDGKDTAHYCDRFGFSQVPEFLQPERAAEVTIPTPDQMATRERISTPRGSFCVTNMTREQMEAAGYGVYHQSDDGKYLIMGNGTRAFAVLAEQPEKDNPLRTAEMTLEDDYGMIVGVINNGRRGEELEKVQEHAERTKPEKPSIRERLEDAKRECAGHKPPEGKKPGRDVPEHDCL